MKFLKCKFSLPVVLLSLIVLVPFASAQKLTAEEIISKHLDSIAAADKRAAVTSLIASGEVRVEFISQKNQPAQGRIVVASEGTKMFFGMSLNASDYPQEKFVFDGNKSSVAMVRSGTRSVLGNFVQSNGVLLSHGILSGTLGSSWVFMNTAESKGKISTSGGKKIDGRETYGITYGPKGGSDIRITMYFDKETFRHVRTEYKRTASASMGATIDESARQSESRMTVTEDFSDFKEFSGLMLPSKYKINYLVVGQSTTEVEWVAEISEYAVNQKLDPGTFSTGN
jgi:outer membrane lipoprotein-sorting protein